MLSWTSFVILIALGELTDSLDSITLRSFINSGDNAVNSFTGWSCGIDSVSPLWGLDLILYILTIIGIILYCACEIGVQIGRAHQRIPRFITWLVIWAGPFVIGKASSPLSIMTAVVMGVLMCLFVWKSTVAAWCTLTGNGNNPPTSYRDCKFNAIPSSVVVITGIACALIGHPDIPSNNNAAFAVALVVLIINIVAGFLFTWIEVDGKRLRIIILTSYCLSFGCGISLITTVYAKSDSPAQIISLWFAFNILAVIAETLLLFRERLSGIPIFQNPLVYAPMGQDIATTGTSIVHTPSEQPTRDESGEKIPLTQAKHWKKSMSNNEN